MFTVNIREIAPAGYNGDWLPYFYIAQAMLGKKGPLLGEPADFRKARGTIFFPAGNYHFSAPLQVFSFLSILGEGAQNTILNFYESAGIIVHYSGTKSLEGVSDPVHDYNLIAPTLPDFTPYATEIQSLMDIAPEDMRLALGSRNHGGESVFEKIGLYGLSRLVAPIFISPITYPQQVQNGFWFHSGYCEVVGFNDGVHIVTSVKGSPDVAEFYQGIAGNPANPWHFGDPGNDLLTSTPFDTDTYAFDVDIVNFTISKGGIPEITPSNINFAIESPLSDYLSHEFITNASGYVTGIRFTYTAPDGGASILPIELMGRHAINIHVGMIINGESAVRIRYLKFTLFHPDHSYPYITSGSNLWQVANSTIRNCNRYGINVRDNDGNAGVCTASRILNTGDWGIFDHSGLGNTYIGCYVENEQSKHYKALGGVNTSVFIGCNIGSEYDEFDKNMESLPGPVEVNNHSVWLGGAKAIRPSDDEGGNVNPFLHGNLVPALGSRRFPNNKQMKVKLSFGTTAISEYSFIYIVENSHGALWLTYANGPYYLRTEGASGMIPIEYNGLGTSFPSGSVYMRKGICLSGDNAADGKKIRFHATDDGASEPQGGTPTNNMPPGNANVSYGKVGDILLNANPIPGDPNLGYAGWICVEDATYVTDPITEEPIFITGRWLPFGLIEN